MAKLNEADFKLALKEMSNQAAKSLILEGVNGNEDFPKLLNEYKWANTKPYDMALIIIAYYTYCRKSKNESIKKFGKEVRSYKLFNYILEGKGSKIKSHLNNSDFTICMVNILEQKFSSDDATRLAPNIIKEMAKKAKDIDLEKMPPDKKSLLIELINKLTNTKINKLTPEEISSTEKVFREKIMSGNDLDDAIKLIKHHKVDPNMNVDWDSEQVPVLAFAYHVMKITHFTNQCNTVLELLKAGADPNVLCLLPCRDFSNKDFMLLDALYTLVCHTLDKVSPVFSEKTKKVYTKLINLLIEKGAKINIKNEKGQTPLMLAVKLNSTNLINNLLSKGAELNVADSDGNTPLLFAVKHNSTDLINLLIEKGAKINIKNKKGQTPLMLAVKLNSTDLINNLLSKGAELNAADNKGKTPLLQAVKLKSTDLVENLIKKGAEFNVVDNDGNTPLLLAVKLKSHVNMIQLLLSRTNNPNTQNRTGDTALHLAAQQGNQEIVSLLLNKGASLNIQSHNGNTPLHVAAYFNKTNIMTQLLADGRINKEILNIQNNDGNTALHLAAYQDNQEIVSSLLNKGASLNIQSHNGNTPLHVAAYFNHQDIINQLIVHDADPDILNNSGQTYQDLLPQPPRHIKVEDFPQDKFRRSLANGEKKECPVCLEEYGAKDLCCIFNCQNSEDYPFGHYLCNNCAQTILDDEDSPNICPLCKKPLKHHN